MSRWPVVRLGDVCQLNPKISRDGRPADETKVSFVPMSAVDEVYGEITVLETKNYRDVAKGYTPFQNGDVLFAKITPCMENGKAAIVGSLSNGLGFGSTEFHVIRPSEKILAEYAFFFIRRPSFRAAAKANFSGTAGQQRVPVGFLASVPIPLPPLTEQRRIVDILNHAAGIRRLRRQALETTRRLIPALFVEMFGDPASNPKGWEERRLQELVTFVSGGTPSKSREEFWVGDLPWVSPKDMKKAEIFDAMDHVNRDLLGETNLKVIPPGSVLIVVRGMILAHTAPVARVAVPLTINQDMKALVPKSVIDGYYLLWVLRVLQPSLLSMVATAAHGTKKLETAQLSNLQIPLPSIDMQRAFSDRVSDLNSLITQQERSLAQAEALMHSLMARYFGETGTGDAVSKAPAPLPPLSTGEGCQNNTVV